MRPRRLLKSFLPLAFCSLAAAQSPDSGDYQGSSFDRIREIVFSDPYPVRPTYRVNKQHFGPSGKHPDNRVYAAGLRTLSSREDLLEFEGGQKLFQANGICFAGEWIIDKPSGYAGLLAKGTRVPVIARASVALDGTLRQHKRAFGMALKLFPTADRAATVETVNAFVMHSLGGVRTDQVLDLALDNAPTLGSLPPFGQWGTARRLQRDFERADEVASGRANVGFRPVWQLAGGQGPRWLRLTVADGTPRVEADDFRDELSLAHYPEGALRWTIAIADGAEGEKYDARWRNVGELRVGESVVSASCDQRLHFAHPRLK